MITKEDIQELDDRMQKLIAKVQLLGLDSKKLEDVCYDVLSEAEDKERVEN